MVDLKFYRSNPTYIRFHLCCKYIQWYLSGIVYVRAHLCWWSCSFHSFNLNKFLLLIIFHPFLLSFARSRLFLTDRFMTGIEAFNRMVIVVVCQHKYETVCSTSMHGVHTIFYQPFVDCKKKLLVCILKHSLSFCNSFSFVATRSRFLVCFFVGINGIALFCRHFNKCGWINLIKWDNNNENKLHTNWMWTTIWPFKLELFTTSKQIQRINKQWSQK